jgi:hypothetical protein
LRKDGRTQIQSEADQSRLRSVFARRTQLLAPLLRSSPEMLLRLLRLRRERESQQRTETKEKQ